LLKPTGKDKELAPPIHKKINQVRQQATNLRYERRYDEAKQLLQELCAEIPQALGTDCLEYIATKRLLCRVLTESGKFKQAEPEIRQAMKACEGKLELAEELDWLENHSSLQLT
jgi:hypothetical protein